ncbi:hypothetical protein P4O66_007436, partial [Electrophorus voltai]
MSVELMNEAINMCKAEEARLNETIQQYRDILRSMKMRLKGSETEESCSFNVKDDEDVSLRQEGVKNKTSNVMSKRAMGAFSFVTCMESTKGKKGQFPIDQPSTQAVVGASELDTLVQLGLDLAHCYHAELQGHQRFAACASGKDPEMSMEREYESLLMLEGLEGMMAKVIKHANYLKKEWERGNEPWWGPQCTLRWRGERAEPGRPCLPPVLSYSSQAELEELAVLRLRVDQLRLEIRLHQVKGGGGFLVEMQ